jgi:hypothetical protein
MAAKTSLTTTPIPEPATYRVDTSEVRIRDEHLAGSNMDEWVRAHFTNWVVNHIAPGDRIGVTRAISKLVGENPEYLDSKSWSEMLQLTGFNSGQDGGEPAEDGPKYNLSRGERG